LFYREEGAALAKREWYNNVGILIVSWLKESEQWENKAVTE